MIKKITKRKRRNMKNMKEFSHPVIMGESLVIARQYRVIKKSLCT